MYRPTFERSDGRGRLLEILNTGRWGSVLCGRMKAGAIMGNHYHRRTAVFFFLMEGRAAVICQDPASGIRQEATLRMHEGVRLEAGIAHAVRFEEPSTFLMLKSVRYDPDDPDTVAHPVLIQAQ